MPTTPNFVNIRAEPGAVPDSLISGLAHLVSMAHYNLARCFLIIARKPTRRQECETQARFWNLKPIEIFDNMPLNACLEDALAHAIRRLEERIDTLANDLQSLREENRLKLGGTSGAEQREELITNICAALIITSGNVLVLSEYILPQNMGEWCVENAEALRAAHHSQKIRQESPDLLAVNQQLNIQHLPNRVLLHVLELLSDHGLYTLGSVSRCLHDVALSMFLRRHNITDPIKHVHITLPPAYTQEVTIVSTLRIALFIPTIETLPLVWLLDSLTAVNELRLKLQAPELLDREQSSL
ncbi:hypothetical protein DXG01_003187 [Tephrocybe rancida]|nr:hypothetical protein DXG01_003187 [Tephrocybe rancida]